MAAASTGREALAERYATALFDLADEQKVLDDVANDLRGLSTLIDESDDLRRLIRSPMVSRAEASGALAAILNQAGAHAVTKNFVGLVAANRRLFQLPAMIKGYLAELARRRGEMTAEVTVARALDQSQMNDLTDALKNALGAQVSVEMRVDPAILGGMIVKVGSRMIDNSLSGRLNRLRFAMKGAH